MCHLHCSHIEANPKSVSLYLFSYRWCFLLLSYWCHFLGWGQVFLSFVGPACGPLCTSRVSVVGPSAFLVSKSKSDIGWTFWNTSWVFTLTLCDHGTLLCGKTLWFWAHWHCISLTYISCYWKVSSRAWLGKNGWFRKCLQFSSHFLS